MVEELRFFFRTALFALLISVIYWFVSYEVAGTVLLVFVILGSGFFVAAAGLSLRPRTDADLTPGRRARSGVGRLAGVFDRLLMFEDEHAPGGDPTEPPLALDEDRFPARSAWPVAGAVAALLLGLGAVFGPWLWIPGLALAASTAWGWATQLRA